MAVYMPQEYLSEPCGWCGERGHKMTRTPFYTVVECPARQGAQFPWFWFGKATPCPDASH